MARVYTRVYARCLASRAWAGLKLSRGPLIIGFYISLFALFNGFALDFTYSFIRGEMLVLVLDLHYSRDLLFRFTIFI